MAVPLPSCPTTHLCHGSLSSQVSHATFYDGSLSSYLCHCYSLRWLSILSCVLYLLDGVGQGHTKDCTATHWSVTVLFQVSHCHCSGLSLSEVSHCHLLKWLHFKYTTFCHWGGSMLSQVFHCYYWSSSVSIQVYNSHSLWWLCVIPGDSRLLTGVIPRHFKCSTATHGDGFMSFQVSNCKSPGWLCHLKYLTSAHWGDSVSCQVSHCNSIMFLCIILGTLLPLAGVNIFVFLCFIVAHYGGSDHVRNTTAAHCGDCVSSSLPTSDYWGCSALSCVSYCWALEWFCFIMCVSLPFPRLVQHGPSSQNVAQLGGSMFSQVFYCVSLGWLIIIYSVILPFTLEDLHHYSYPSAVQCSSLVLP